MDRDCPKSWFLNEIQKIKFHFSKKTNFHSYSALKRPLDFELLFWGDFHTYEIGQFQLQNYIICDPGWKLLQKRMKIVVSDCPLPQKVAC